MKKWNYILTTNFLGLSGYSFHYCERDFKPFNGNVEPIDSFSPCYIVLSSVFHMVMMMWCLYSLISYSLYCLKWKIFIGKKSNKIRLYRNSITRLATECYFALADILNLNRLVFEGSMRNITTYVIKITADQVCSLQQSLYGCLLYASILWAIIETFELKPLRDVSEV